jgi:hypothetical protein
MRTRATIVWRDDGNSGRLLTVCLKPFERDIQAPIACIDMARRQHELKHRSRGAEAQSHVETQNEKHSMSEVL